MNVLSLNGRVARTAWWVVGSLLTIAGLISYSILYVVVVDPYLETKRQAESGLDIRNPYDPGSTIHIVVMLLFLLNMLIVSIIGLSFNVRRWHDLGKSGWWSLISLVPIAGTIYAFAVLGFMAGNPGHNKYGPAPGKHEHGRAVRDTATV